MNKDGEPEKAQLPSFVKDRELGEAPAQGQKPHLPTAKLKFPSDRPSVAAADIVSTSLVALKESADAFPPLKSAVGAVLALWEIAERAENCKSDAHDIVLRAKTVLDNIADAVPNPSSIPEAMRRSIDCLTALLNDEICASMKTIVLSDRFSRVVRLKRNEHMLRSIRTRLDDAYKDFQTASTLRVEGQQNTFVLEQKQQQAQVYLTIQRLTAAVDAGRRLTKIMVVSHAFILFGRPRNSDRVLDD
ncbi:hypothetical protein B0H16DRAFT_1887664 [Mycena metata]|uniref:Uncharacterized protein n=1 Tax=Mycena metata TaxID=1033252 RepID=A0AAD7N8X7_9AGAR|nr:hypothetical protein B0H16DRAFT_1887664 [Mycena metata]